MEEFYSNPDKNLYDLHINEYLLVHNTDGECVDRLCWTGEGYRHLSYNNFNSRWFGDIKPMKGDIYQSLAADSLMNNKITLMKGPAGSGKTFLSLAFLMHKLERNKIDRIALLEEYVDVMIILEQIKILYKLNDKDINLMKKMKLDRLQERLENNNL